MRLLLQCSQRCSGRSSRSACVTAGATVYRVFRCRVKVRVPAARPENFHCFRGDVHADWPSPGQNRDVEFGPGRHVVTYGLIGSYKGNRVGASRVLVSQ